METIEGLGSISFTSGTILRGTLILLYVMYKHMEKP